MKYCKNCGKEIEENQKFCNKCGTENKEGNYTTISCDRCNVGMIEDLKIEGQHPFEIGIDGSSELLVYTKGKSIFMKSNEVKCRMCPKCGKVELYIDIK